ncbi:MAG: GNAT family N-acetyltransferase [Dehalococcoidia bacterium]|nr:GNAT family N-acetyltransferase [Dehalococcoidia bacterium]
MSQDFVIEEVRDLDAAWPELEALLRDSHEFYMPIVGYGPPVDWISEVQSRFRPGPDSMLLLARSEGRAVAFANAYLRTTPGSPPPRFIYVDNVYVLAEARGRGIGSALLSCFESWARERGVEEIRLDVFASNDHAVDFWRQAGFTIRAHSMSKSLAGAAS